MNIFETLLTQPLFNLLILVMSWIPGHSLGWAIIALTFLVRLALLPSSAHALRQQHKMQQLQPEIKAVQDRHKGDQQAQAQALMALYKKYDIHPLGSCLPMLIQLPILFALYYVFIHGVDASRLDLLYSFVPRPEAINTSFLGIDLTTRSIFLAVAAAAAQFAQSWMLVKSPKRHQPENTTQRILNTQLVYFMPLLTGVISLTLPAALPLYWLMTTLFSLAQQWWLFRQTPQVARINSPVTPVIASPAPVPPTTRGGVAVTVRKRGQS